MNRECQTESDNEDITVTIKSPRPQSFQPKKKIKSR